MFPIRIAAAGLVLTLATGASALQIGAWVGSASDTSLDGTYPQPTQENVAAFVQLQGRTVEYVQQYIIWPSTWASQKRYIDVAANNGATALVTWQPNGYTAPDINNGKADTYITTFANAVKVYPHEVWLRPLHEANGGDWYSWNVGNSSMLNTDSNVAAAYRHIVTIFRNAGVTNVKWVWTTTSSNSSGGNPTSFAGTYPGDDYVDYISIDGYNFGTFHTVANSGWASSWQTFRQVFAPAYNALAGINKPLFIAEFSSSELGGNKAQWYRDAFASLSGTFPRIFALVVFSNNVSDGDWRINTTDSSLAAWRWCVAKYASLSTGVRSSLSRPSTQVRRAGSGRILLDLAEANAVEIRVLDGSGALLDRRDLGRLSAGSHDVALGPSATVRMVEVRAGSERTRMVLGLE
jgi:hypothetical protein